MNHHDHYSTRQIIDALSQTKTIAMVGASANQVRPSFFVLKYLVDKGYAVTPINPGQAGQAIAGQMAYASLADLPAPVDMVDVFRPVTALPTLFDEILALPVLPKYVWLQLAIRDDAEAARLEEQGIIVIQDRCPKIEFARLSGEIGWNGVRSNVISSKKQILGNRAQSRKLPLQKGEQ